MRLDNTPPQLEGQTTQGRGMLVKFYVLQLERMEVIRIFG